MTEGVFQAIAERFAAAFPAERPAWRTVGREAEYPIVRADGSAADIRELWPLLLAGGDLKPQREGSLIVGLDGPRYRYGMEVGLGTVELITGPAPDLMALARDHAAGLQRLLDACATRGLRLLGYGIQPRTPASGALMAPKRRYGLLLEVIGPDWLTFTLTASDQVHVAIGRDEIIAQTDRLNLLAPLVVALCANSPIWAGAEHACASGRETLMGVIDAGRCRHGLPSGPSRDLASHVARMAEFRQLLRRRGGELHIPSGTCSENLKGAATPEEAWQDWLLHDHYIWHSARPRAVHGTVELRAACQQPPGETWAAAALGVGLAAAGETLDEVLRAKLGQQDPWPAMRAWHGRARAQGLAATPPAADLGPGPGLCDAVLSCCATALGERGRGEEALLAPLFRRLAQGRNPAQTATEVFRRGGISALIDHVALTTA